MLIFTFTVALAVLAPLSRQFLIFIWLVSFRPKQCLVPLVLLIFRFSRSGNNFRRKNPKTTNPSFFSVAAKIIPMQRKTVPLLRTEKNRFGKKMKMLPNCIFLQFFILQQFSLMWVFVAVKVFFTSAAVTVFVVTVGSENLLDYILPSLLFFFTLISLQFFWECRFLVSLFLWY